MLKHKLSKFHELKKEVKNLARILADLSVKNRKDRISKAKEKAKQIEALAAAVPDDVKVDEVSWTEEWGPISFADLTNDEILAKQADVMDYVQQSLSTQDLLDGTSHTIQSHKWDTVTTSPLTLKLSVYLDPDAVLVTDGGPTGSISPQPPPPPQ